MYDQNHVKKSAKYKFPSNKNLASAIFKNSVAICFFNEMKIITLQHLLAPIGKTNGITKL